MKRERDRGKRQSDVGDLWRAQADYAESIFRNALGDIDASIAAAERALLAKADYAPAILTMGSIEYQRGRAAEGRRLFLSLLSLPNEDGDLGEVIDAAGDFLIQCERYADGLELYKGAVALFPDRAALYQGLGCCAGHEGSFDEAVAACRKALELVPDCPRLTNDLGWTLFLAERIQEAVDALRKAVAMDPSYALARANLQHCESQLSKKADEQVRGSSPRTKRQRHRLPAK